MNSTPVTQHLHYHRTLTLVDQGSMKNFRQIQSNNNHYKLLFSLNEVTKELENRFERVNCIEI